MINPTVWALAILLVIAENTLYFRAWPRHDIANRIAVVALILAAASAMVAMWAHTYAADTSMDADEAREARFLVRSMASVALAFLTQSIIMLFLATHDSKPIGLPLLAGVMQLSIWMIIAQNVLARMRAGRG